MPPASARQRCVPAAQPRNRPPRLRIGLLDPGNSLRIAGFLSAMSRLGYIEGQNIFYLRTDAEGRNQDFRRVAGELAALKPDAIVTASGQATRAAMRATPSIPIVFVSVGDAVSQGIVRSLSRPGGNVTGPSFIDIEVSPKRLQLLHEIVPAARRVGVLFDPANPQSDALVNIEKRAAESLGLHLQVLAAPGPAQFESAFANLANGRADAVHLLGSIVFSAYRRELVSAAAKHRLPAIYQNADFVHAGGLAAYSPSFAEMERYAAVCVEKILKGATPTDLPVEQPTKFDLMINLKTAKALGLTVPQSLLARADEIIE